MASAIPTTKTPRRTAETRDTSAFFLRPSSVEQRRTLQLSPESTTRAERFPVAAEPMWHRGAVPLPPDENAPVARDPDAMPRWVPRAIGLFFVGAAAFFVGRWLISKLDGLLIILVVSLFLSFAIEPAVNWLAARGWRRGVATSLAFVVLFAVTVIFVVAIATVVVRQLTRFVESAPEYLE